MKPLISLITVCFNSEKTIERTIKSVLAQNYDKLEYVIIDGASTDSTLSIIERYRNELEKRISLKIISEPDDGIYDAMNKGIKQCTGDVIGIINSDDWYENDAIINVVNNCPNNTDMFLIYGMERMIDVNGQEIRTFINRHENMENMIINHPTCFLSRKVYDEVGLFDLQYISSSDYDFLLRCFYNRDITFCPVYKIITNFTLGGMSSNWIGGVESVKIQYKYGIINRKKYLISMIKKYLVKTFG